MLQYVLTDKVVLQKWLKAGYMENRILFPTEAGTPQGGIISPTLANMTLGGCVSYTAIGNEGIQPRAGITVVATASRRKTQGKSVIFVLQMQHARLETTIQEDQKDVCRLASRTFYWAVLEPGQHQLGVYCEFHWGSNLKETKIGKQTIISVEPDHVYYFSAGVAESESPEIGLFQSGINSTATVFVRRCSDWLVRDFIRDRRTRLTGELIGVQ